MTAPHASREIFTREGSYKSDKAWTEYRTDNTTSAGAKGSCGQPK
jgi:hypothetical protein